MEQDGASPFFSTAKPNEGGYAPFGPIAQGRCGALSPAALGARWQALDCAEQNGFICELPGPSQRLDLGGSIPGCLETGTCGKEPITPCITLAEAGMPTDTETFRTQINDCDTNCKAATDDGCTKCKGAAAIPPEGNNCKDTFGKCLRVQGDGKTACTNSKQCKVAGEICGWLKKANACDGKTCDNAKNSHESRVCGPPHPSCLTAASDAGLRCAEQVLCAENPLVQTTTELDPESQLGQIKDPAAGFKPKPVAAPEFYPADPACPAGAACGKQKNNHPRCHLNVDDTVGKPDSPPVDRSGGAGKGQLVSVNFAPGLSLDYDLTPGPLGEPNVNLTASATLRAGAHFNVLNKQGDVDVVNASFRAHMDRCVFDADASLLVFGEDYVPAVKYTTDSTDYSDPKNVRASKADCEANYRNYVESANRSKKALRDAQELITQYYTRRANGKRFPDLFLDDLRKATRGYPSGFSISSAAYGEGGAGPDTTPEDIINSLVRFYFAQTDQTRNAQLYLWQQSPRTPGFTYSLPPAKETEQLTLLNLPFMIGPIPMTLELAAQLAYGLRGSVDLVRDGATDLDINEVRQVAEASVAVTPYATAKLLLFVGASFDVGVASARAGLTGDVTLVNLTAPLNAGVGVQVRAVPDERAMPADLAAYTDKTFLLGTNVFGAKTTTSRYVYNATYRYGAALRIKDVLAGQVDGYVKLKFAFFSKSWQQQLLKFNGKDFPDVVLVGKKITGKDTKSTVSPLKGSDKPLGEARMPMPFPSLRFLEADPTMAPRSTAKQPMPMDFHDVEKLFYEHQCTCLTKDQNCGHDGACCDEAPYCSMNSSFNRTCQTCRATGNDCATSAECCAEAPLCIASGGPSGRSTCQACATSGGT